MLRVNLNTTAFPSIAMLCFNQKTAPKLTSDYVEKPNETTRLLKLHY